MSDSTYRGPDGVVRRKPDPKPEQAKPKPHPLEFMLGKRLVIQRGVVTYIGKLTVITSRWLILTEARIVGSTRTVDVPTAYVNADSGFIAHVHEEMEAQP